MTTLALLVILLLTLFFGWLLFGHFMNPITMYSSVWLLVLVVYLFQSSSYYPLSPSTLNFLACASLAFVGGSCVARLASSRLRAGPVSWAGYDERRFGRAYRILLIMDFGSVAMSIFSVLGPLRAAGGFSAIFSSGAGLSFRSQYLAQRLDSAGAQFGAGGVVLGALGYLLFLGTGALLMAGYYAARGDFGRASVPLLLSAVYSLVLLQRAGFLYAAALFCMSWVYHSRLLAPARGERVGLLHRKVRVFPLVAAGVSALVVLVPIAVRRAGGATQGGVIEYIASGIAGLNALATRDPSLQAAATGALSPFAVSRAISGEQLGSGHGAWTFQGVTGILSRFGIPVNPTLPSLNYIQTGPAENSLSNTYSFLIYFIYDGGMLAVAILSLILGLVVGVADLGLRGRAHAAWLPLACLGMAAVAMSFFGLSLIRDLRYLVMTAALSVILTRLELNGPKSAEQAR